MTKTRPGIYFNNAVEAISRGKHRSGDKWLKVARFFGYSMMDIYFQKGVIAFENLKLGDALRYFHSSLSLSKNPDQALLYYLGDTYYFLGNIKEAIRYYKNAFEEGSDKLYQCKALTKLENLKYYSSETVKELFEKKLRFIWNHDEANMEQCRISALTETLKGNYQKAIELFREVISYDPQSIEPYKELSECYLRIKEYDEILSLFNNKKHFLNRDKTLSLFLGKVYYLSHNYEDAKRELLKVSNAVQGNPKVYYNLGNVCYKLGQFNRASKYYLKATQEDSEFHQSYQNLAVLYHKSGMLELAEKYYIQSKEIIENQYSTHYNLGILYYQKKDYFNSLNQFFRSNQINPQDFRSMHNLNAVKKIKLIDPELNVDKQILSMVNIYLFVIAGLLLLFFIYFN